MSRRILPLAPREASVAASLVLLRRDRLWGRTRLHGASRSVTVVVVVLHDLNHTQARGLKLRRTWVGPDSVSSQITFHTRKSCQLK